jgi:hypothetical protein
MGGRVLGKFPISTTNQELISLFTDELSSKFIDSTTAYGTRPLAI